MSREEHIKTFLFHLLDVSGQNPYGISLIDGKLFTQDERIALMMDRLRAGCTSVLPFRRQGSIYWLVCSRDLRTLLRDYAEVSCFVRPFCDKVDPPIRTFEASMPIGLPGGLLFPDGYGMLKASAEHEDAVWRMIKLWTQLDKRRPLIQSHETERTAFSLRSEFQQHLVLENWEEAARVLETIRQGHYVSDENYLFLKIRLWSQKGAWEKIWYAKEFDSIARMDMIPLQVRRALLAAFYHEVLAEHEESGDFAAACNSYEQHRFRLAPLLHTSLGLNEEIYVRIFAYESFFLGDWSRLEHLSAAASGETEHLLAYLLEQKPESTGKPPEPSPGEKDEERALSLLRDKKYDDVYAVLLQCPATVQSVDMLCRLAAATEAPDVYRSAYTYWNALSPDEQAHLENAAESQAAVKLVLLWTRAQTPAKAARTVERESWHHWFSFLLDNEMPANEIEERLQYIDDYNRACTWSISVLNELSEWLAAIALEELAPQKRAVLEMALPFFISDFLLVEGFPKPQAMNVYHYTTELMLVYGRRNAAHTALVLKLMEGLLYIDPACAPILWKRMKDWFSSGPVKTLLSQALAALELFEEYGLLHDELREMWEHWTASLGEGIKTVPLSDLEAWREIGRIISAEAHLLQQMDRYFDSMAMAPEDDSIARLPAMQIAIFTLREQTAQRAVMRLRERNPGLTFQICTDDTLTDRAKAYARHADAAVLVTSCMSHALFYGISPYLKRNPVYPKSSGTSGIIAALEEYFQKEAFS